MASNDGGFATQRAAGHEAVVAAQARVAAAQAEGGRALVAAQGALGEALNAAGIDQGGPGAPSTTSTDSALPSAAGRQAIMEGTQGPAATGALPAKEGAESASAPVTNRSAYKKVGRTIGVVPKSEVYAVIFLTPDAGTSSDVTFQSDRFLLQSVVQQQTERYQIVETFRKHLLYFMDKGPEIYRYAGTLYNCVMPAGDGEEGGDPNWRDDFLAAYEDLLRGTQCVRNRTRVTLDYDGVQVSGYMLNNSIQQSSNEPFLVQFQFDLFVTSKRLMGGGQ